MLRADDIRDFRPRSVVEIGYEEAVKEVQDKVRELAMGKLDITYEEGSREFQINSMRTNTNPSIDGLSLKLTKGQISSLLSSNPHSAHQTIRNLMELEEHVERAFREGLITWEQRSLIAAVTTWNENIDPHRGLGVLRFMLHRREWIEFLRSRNCMPEGLEAELSSVSPIEGLMMLGDVFSIPSSI